MTPFLLCFAAVSGAFGIHVLVHRYLLTKGIVSMKSALVYAIGLILYGAYTVGSGTPLLFTGMLLYSFASLLLVSLYLTVYLGGETPSSMMLHALKRGKKQTDASLSGLFSDERLVRKRISDLLNAGFVQKRNTSLVITPRGTWVAGAVRAYRILFHRPMTG